MARCCFNKEKHDGTSSRTYTDPNTHAYSDAHSNADANGRLMLETYTVPFLAVATLAAVVGLLAGNRTAMVLLASLIYSSILCWAKVPFNPALWIAIDLIAIMWIVILWADRVGRGLYGKTRDIAILALFAPMWAMYFSAVDWRAGAIDIMIALQMFMTLPWKRAGACIKSFILRGKSGANGGFELAWI